MVLPLMEVVGLHTSISFSGQTRGTHRLHPFQFTTQDKRSLLQGCSFQFRARRRNPELVFPQTNLSVIRGINASQRVEEEDDIDDSALASPMSSFEDENSSASTFLSLSEKPDRNMALLDDYELEELDFSSNPNHRSGTYSFPFPPFSFCEVICLLFDWRENSIKRKANLNDKRTYRYAYLQVALCVLIRMLLYSQAEQLELFTFR